MNKRQILEEAAKSVAANVRCQTHTEAHGRNAAVDHLRNLASLASLPGSAAERTEGVLDEVAEERTRQIELWGDQAFPLFHRTNTTGSKGPLRRTYHWLATTFKAIGKKLGSDDSWDRVLLEEVFEAFAEMDPVVVREEMVQVAAVAVKIVEEIDRGRV